MFPQIRLQGGVVSRELLVIYKRGILAKLFGGFAVAIQELIEARELLAVDVAVPASVAIILTAIVTRLLSHEGVGILLYLLANSRMLLQIGLQLGMVLHVFVVIYEGWILAKLLGSFAVRVQKLIEACKLLAVDVAVPVSVAIILTAIVTRFLPHKGIRIFLYLLANLRMLLQVVLERRMLLHEVIVVHKRRIFAKLSGEFGMAIQELIEARQFLAGRVVVLNVWSIPSGHGLRVCGCAKPEKSRECRQCQPSLEA